MALYRISDEVELTAAEVNNAISRSIAALGGGTVTSVSFTGGLISVATATTTPALTVAGTSGGIPYFSAATTWATSAALAANALVIGGGAGAAPATTTTGTGVLAALGVNTGSAGAFVTFNGALGTPSSGTVTNLTGTASININGTVGATTPAAGSFTTLSATGVATFDSGSGALPALISTATARLGQADAVSNGIQADGFGATGFQILSRRTNGTRASPSATPASGVILDLLSYGFTNALRTTNNARYRTIAKSLWSATNAETQHIWSATPSGSLTVADVMTLDSVGLTVTGTILNTYSGAGAGAAITNSSDTSGTAFLDFKKANGTTIGNITRNAATDAVLYNLTSDESIKTNIVEVNHATVRRLVRAAMIYDYVYRTGNAAAIGVIAQRLAAADPLFVTLGIVTPGDTPANFDYTSYQARKDRTMGRRLRNEAVRKINDKAVLETNPEDSLPDPRLWAVNYMGFVPLLLDYAQQETARLDVLTARVAALEARP